MSKKRVRKIKRLRRRHVWPHLFLSLLVLIVFNGAFVASAYLFFENTLENKVISGYQRIAMIADVLNRQNSDEYITQNLFSIRSIIPEIASLCVVDANNKCTQHIGTQFPNLNEAQNLLASGQEMTLIPLTEELFIVTDSGSLVINPATVQENVRDVHVQFERLSYQEESATWKAESCWFIVPYGEKGEKLCVLCDVAVTNYEINSIAVASLIALTLAGLLCLHQIWEVVKILNDRRKIRKLVYTDFSTGAMNRIFFRDTGDKLLRRRLYRQYAVVQLQMEKYRNYCMYYSEEKGEDLLERIQEYLVKFINHRECVAHIEAADFALLLMYTNETELNQRINGLMQSLKGLIPTNKDCFLAGVSACGHENDVMHYYIEAGVARHSIRDDSETRILWFNEDLKATQIWERKVEDDMEGALSRHEFQLFIQPKYSAKEEKIAGGEALIRWMHPTEGFVSPGRFIPIFENNGFITKIDDYMISALAAAQAKWLSEGKPIVPISVNVSRVHFMRDDLAEHICSLVDAYNVPHEYIELELTESAFFDDKDVLLRIVKKMQSYGFHVSMDDFGSGYSSLNSLKELPLNVIKLDAEFFRGSDDLIERSKVIVRNTIELAKELGMTIVAEGVEYREQVDFLASIDCDLIQGFYFDKPMPAQEFAKKAFGE